ncbi:MAG TPA: acyltransferase [Sphingomonas sp.]|nr:acyltransferase [Sphingomonas sp.]
MEADAAAGNLIKPLTSIRFFAAIFVVMYHSGSGFINAQRHIPDALKSVLLNGYTGVTFFFVLSGFILHHTYRCKLLDQDNIKRFAVARFARIYPVYLITVILMFPFVGVNHDWRDLPQFFLLHWWITAPWPLLGLWNGPSWTISVEAFFYLCFPLLTARATKFSTRSICLALLVLAALDFATGSSSFFSLHPAYFDWLRWVPTPIVRLPEFAIGVFVGELHFRRGGQPFPIPSWVLIATILLMFCISHQPWVASAVTVLAALLIFSIAGDRGSLVARFLGQRWLVLLGAASYSLYLIHQPVHFYMVWLLGESKWLVPLQYLTAVGGSVLVFLYIEEPVREWIRSRVRMRPSAIEEVADRPL